MCADTSDEAATELGAPAGTAAHAAQMEYALRQFLFIADQRIKTFNFYVVVLAASSATTMKLATEFQRLEFFLVGGFHLAVVAVFWMIEQRNLRLLRIAKRALMRLEAQQRWPAWARLAAVDDRVRHWISYQGAIGIAFFSQFLLGVLLVTCAVVHSLRR